MAGYKIDLYRYIQLDMQQQRYKDLIKRMIQERQSGLNDNEEKNRGYLTYGEFDRMEINRVTDYTRFRDMSGNSRYWLGQRQSVLLYELLGENEIIYAERKTPVFLKKVKGREIVDESLFIGLTIFQFKEIEKNEHVTIEKYLEKCKKGVKEVVKERKTMCQGEITCEVFGVLGLFGVAVIWLADQYTDVLKLVNVLKQRDIAGNVENRKHIFLSAFTLFAHNHVNDRKKKDKIQAIKGDALIQLTLKTSIDAKLKQELEKYFEELNNESYLHCVGEYDLIFSVKSREVYLKIAKGDSSGEKNLLDLKHKFYIEHVL